MATQANEAISIVPPGYLTREQAMKTLEKSETSIERLVRTGELASKLFPAPGRRPVRYYTAESVEAFKALEERKRAATPPSVLRKREEAKEEREPPPRSLALAVPDSAVTFLREALERLTALKPVAVTEKLWLSLDEAAELSGLARADLLRLVKAGTLIARKSGGWKILRKSLEAFEG
jgi:helix-turn-helix protein